MKTTIKATIIAAFAAFAILFTAADEPYPPDDYNDDCQVYQDNYESALAESYEWLQYRDTLIATLNDLLDAGIDPFDPMVAQLQAEIEFAESQVNWHFGWAQYWEARYFDEGCG